MLDLLRLTLTRLLVLGIDIDEVRFASICLLQGLVWFDLCLTQSDCPSKAPTGFDWSRFGLKLLFVGLKQLRWSETSLD